MNFCIFNHHIIKKNLHCLNKLGSRELHQISRKYKKPTSQMYYEGYINNFDFNWKPIYLTTHGNYRYKIKSFSVQNSK